MVKARKIVLARSFEGNPRLDDFRVEEEDLPRLQDGHILVEAVYISIEPLGRAYKKGEHGVGSTMVGSQVALIVESRAVDYPVGRHIFGYWGWRDRTVVNMRPDAQHVFAPPILVPDIKDLPLSLSLGTLGMPGVTAYFGVLEICKPKAGEVVVVSGAAGAVGSIAGQVARIMGCTVIGFAGSDTKVKWLKEELGFHHAFNYKTTDIGAALKEVAPDGVDVYFDNVGGEQTSAVINSMRDWGRIAVCGVISEYNELTPPKVTSFQPAILWHQLRMEGFIYTRWQHRWDEGVHQLAQWIREGKLKHKESVIEGFLHTPKAFIGLLKGETFGKAVIKV